jgi:DedD protein
MAGLSAQEELILLRKRARRRLVGALVMVMIATVVLWKVVGRVQEEPMKPESVLIVGVASSGTLSRAPASAGAVQSPPADASHPAATALPESLSTLSQPVASQPVASAPAKRKPAVVPAKAGGQATAPHKKAVDPAAILEGRAEGGDAAPTHESTVPGDKVVIQLAALSDQTKADALKTRLNDLGVQARFSKVSTSKGDVTRVRVGPFANRQEADAVLKKLARSGVTGIIVSLHTP